MRRFFENLLLKLDMPALAAALIIAAAGLVVLYTHSGESLIARQGLWLALSMGVFFSALFFPGSLLSKTTPLTVLFAGTLVLLGAVLVFGEEVLGARNRFDLGFFSFQPSDPAQVVLILVLAKYFSRRHAEIGAFRHIIISGCYAFAVFALLFLEPDFGTAVIVFFIWLGMILVSGASKKHLLLIMLGCVAVGASLWFFALAPYQKERIVSFLHPLSDVRGAGYNAFQSMVAVGSGGLFGKGVGYGTQSELAFLPEYETDFIFAAFAEEWGLVGSAVLLGLYAFLLLRMLARAREGATNFEKLFGLGLVLYLLAHITVHVGMNVGLLPVTGVTLPFMSYGGSHLITEFFTLGLLMGMRRKRAEVGKEQDIFALAG